MSVLKMYRNSPSYIMETPKLFTYSVAVNGDGTTSSTLEVRPLVTSSPFDQSILVTDLSIQTMIEMGNLTQMKELPPMSLGGLDSALHNAESFVEGFENLSNQTNVTE